MTTSITTKFNTLSERITALEQHVCLRAEAMGALVERVEELEAKPSPGVTHEAFASLANRVAKLEENVTILGADIGKLAVETEVESTRSRTATAPQTSDQELRATIVRWLRGAAQDWRNLFPNSIKLSYSADALLDAADAIENGEPERWAAEEEQRK